MARGHWYQTRMSLIKRNQSGCFLNTSNWSHSLTAVQVFLCIYYFIIFPFKECSWGQNGLGSLLLICYLKPQKTTIIGLETRNTTSMVSELFSCEKRNDFARVLGDQGALTCALESSHLMQPPVQTNAWQCPGP